MIVSGNNGLNKPQRLGRQIYLSEAPLASDETAVLADFRRTFNLAGKRVLEIGGCIPADLTRDTMVWWSVDPAHPERVTRDHQRCLRASGEALPAEIQEVDLIFACNSFQHVGSMAGCYEEMARVLVPGGSIFAHFGPIWTAPDGAHFENVALSSGRYDFWIGARVPSWSHLVLDRDVFRALAVEINGETDGGRLADYVEGSSWINRLGLAEHLALPSTKGLTLSEVRGARAFGYDYRHLAPPAWCAAAFESDALAQAFALHGISLAEAEIRDLRLILTREAPDT